MNLFTNGFGVFGEYSIFNMPFYMTDKTGTMPDNDIFGEMQMDDVNYLQKGEKILSLLREKKPRYGFVSDKVLEMIKPAWGTTLKAAEKKIGAKLEQGFIETLEAGGGGQEALQNACDELGRQLAPGLRITSELRKRENQLINVLCDYKQRAIVNVVLEGDDIVIPVGCSFNKKYERACRLSRDCGPFIDVRNFKRFFSEQYLRYYLLKTLRKLKEQSGSEEEYASHRVIGKLLEEAKSAGVDIDYQYLKENPKARIRNYLMVVFYPESEEALDAVTKVANRDIHGVLLRLQDDYKKRKAESMMDKELSREHAKSFQTKKNIPQKCIRAMSRSGFNKYFGYVEFDEECDLKLVEELCREYHAFVKELQIDEYPEVSLRFRKLGHHKASGLYYYLLKCLCVDVRSPGSMVHEVGHMIDYHLDHISIKYCFQQIYDLYEQNLRQYLKSSDDPQVEVLKGKTKYNLGYYLQPTEVFARCFEIYVVRVRGVSNSLCKPDEGFAYPKDERLTELIKEFYDGILRKEIKEEAA